MLSQGGRITWTRWYEPTGEPNGETGENYAILIPLEYNGLMDTNLKDYWNDASVGDSSVHSNLSPEINVLCVRERKRGIHLILVINHES